MHYTVLYNFMGRGRTVVEAPSRREARRKFAKLAALVEEGANVAELQVKSEDFGSNFEAVDVLSEKEARVL